MGKFVLYIAAISIFSLLASLSLTVAGVGVPVAVLHLAFAVGIVPLIFAAMIHFLPVLTRTGDPERWILRLPVFAQFAGLLAVAAMAGWLPRYALHLAAAVDLVLGGILLRWLLARAKECLGKPHPGWRWYGMALLCLLAALLLVPLMMAVPMLYAPLRLLHLHLNTLGLVALAALGTLPVLLPTAMGMPDPLAADWLRNKLWPLQGALILLLVGLAIGWPLSLPGGMALLWGVGSLLRQWLRQFGWQRLLTNRAAAPLLAATVGLGLALLGGFAHAAGLRPAYTGILVWAAAFLLPLVTGALGQLLPVWRWPGRLTPEREAMRQKLVASGIWRAVLFLLAGGALLSGEMLLGGVFAAGAMVLFLIGVLQAVGVSRSTR